jgi:N-formylglutamate amidohydrolase
MRYDQFYRVLSALYWRMAERYGVFVVLDLHSYNGSRPGLGKGEGAGNGEFPQVNLGTESVDRKRYGLVLRVLHQYLSDSKVGGRALSVEENMVFKGGHHPRWANARFYPHACVIAVEVRKFFMDEWTGIMDPQLHEEMGMVLQGAVEPLAAALKSVV